MQGGGGWGAVWRAVWLVRANVGELVQAVKKQCGDSIGRQWEG